MKNGIEQKKIRLLNVPEKSKKKHPLRKRSSRMGFRLLLLFSILAGAIILIFIYSPNFHLQEVRLSGNQLVSEPEVFYRARLKRGKNFFLINTQQLEREILQDYRIAKVKVTKKNDNSLKIEIQERKYFCLISFLNNELILSEDFRVIKRDGKEGQFLLPLITGISLKNLSFGEKIKDLRLSFAKKIVEYVKANFVCQILEINLKEYYIYLEYPQHKEPIKVLLGDETFLRKKFQKFEVILSQIDARRVKTVDLRLRDFPTIIYDTDPN